MNIHEIARRARVSTATASRAINRVPTVSPELAKRVWNVVEKLGYYPNTQARALVSGSPLRKRAAACSTWGPMRMALISASR